MIPKFVSHYAAQSYELRNRDTSARYEPSTDSSKLPGTWQQRAAAQPRARHSRKLKGRREAGLFRTEACSSRSVFCDDRAAKSVVQANRSHVDILLDAHGAIEAAHEVDEVGAAARPTSRARSGIRGRSRWRHP